MVKAVLFDFDGVLTLDQTGSESICNYVTKTAQIDRALFACEYGKYNRDLLNGTRKHDEVWNNICNAIGMSIDIRVLQDSFVNTPINTEILGIVEKAKAMGFHTAMVTDNKPDRIRNIVAHYQWETLFDCIAVSAEIGSGKNNVKIFNFVFEALAVKPNECVFIDNTKENLQIPKKLGVKTYFFDFKENDVAKLKLELQNLGVKI